MKFSKPAFINPEHPIKKEEMVGMAFPVDSTYFDQFPLIFCDGLSDIAGWQNPCLEES